MRYRVLTFSLVLIACAAPARAQQPLQLQIAEGRVTLHAQNVPIRTILAEWARLGGAKVINGDRVAGAPLTLDLEGVPERQALDIILRGVSGYMLAAREPGTTGSSMFDRIMILPTSAAPRNAPASPVAIFSNAPNGIVRPVPPRPPGDDQDADIPGAPGDEDGVQIPMPVAIQRPTPNPVGTPVFPPAPINTPDDISEARPNSVVVTPSNPFGLPPGSSLRPGVVTPAPPSTVPPPVRNGPQN